MPEFQTATVPLLVRYACDALDGGELISVHGPTDAFGKFLHHCTEPKDKTDYYLPKMYPYEGVQDVNLDIIPGLKI